MAETKDSNKNEKTESPDKVSAGSTKTEEASKIEASIPSNKKPNVFKRFGHFYGRRKKVMIPLTILLLLGILAAIPFTRYKIAGSVLKQTVSVTVRDSITNAPITQASVAIDTHKALTDSKGKAAVKNVPVGDAVVSVTKKYYKSSKADILVSIFTSKTSTDIKLVATGRQVPVTVVNKITGLGAKNISIKALDSEIRTDDKGKAVIVLPATAKDEQADITAEGYNPVKVKVQVTEKEIPENIFELTPAGKIYYLSKRTGKINVMKSNLDGSDAQIVVAGTGAEEDQATVLLAARDWRYLAFKSKRDSTKQPSLYLIDTTTDKMITIDEGSASFEMVGWFNHNFIYKVHRVNTEIWQPKREAIKSFSADDQKLITLDETQGGGTSVYDYAGEQIDSMYILNNKVVYTKRWSSSYLSPHMSGKQTNIMSVEPSGKNKKSLKAFDAASISYINAILYKPQEIYYLVYLNNSTTQTFEFENDQFKSEAIAPDKFGQFYPTYIVSPTGQETFWTEPRDGKNSLFIGDIEGEKGTEIAGLSEYTAYGWFSDAYALVSKDSSELYIMPRSAAKALKITDYHKPAQNFSGYGYGYGGF